MKLHINNIRRDADLQVRVATDTEAVADYALRLKAGDTLPKPVVFNDGKHYWLADGNHTIDGHEKNGVFEVECDVRKGTRRDALSYALNFPPSNGRVSYAAS